MRRFRTRGAAWTYAWCVMLAAAAAPALAHHSFAMFDHEHQIKLYGTVAHFQWTNPHVYIYLDVDPSSASGAVSVKHYTIECANPGILDRAGWKWNMIKVGDKITTVIAPLRAGGRPAQRSHFGGRPHVRRWWSGRQGQYQSELG